MQKMKIYRALVSVALLVAAASAQDTLKIMTYNPLNYSSSDASRDPYYRTVLRHTRPDVLAVQEITTQTDVDSFFDRVVNVVFPGQFSKATFVYRPGDTNQELYYRSSKFAFISNTAIKTDLRDINQFTLYSTVANDTLRIYNVHLKASTGSANEAQRALEVDSLRRVTNALGANKYFMVMGDYNIYGSTEQAYQKLLQAPDNGRFVDTIHLSGTWQDIPAYAPYHTQSTRTRSFGGGATGGLDDRFDMILFSRAIASGSGKISYVGNSMTPVGNDGNHLNDSINRLPNNAVPDSVANALAYGSDHLPVYARFVFSPGTGTSQSITASAGPNGTINPNGTVVVTYGGSQAFVVSPSSGYHVDSLIVDGVKTDSSTSYTFLNVIANHTIRAVFASDLTPISVTVSTNPSGRQITVDGTPYISPQTFSWTSGSLHTIGTTSPQAGSTGTQYVFSNWSDAGAQTHSITTPSSGTTYTANFTTQYLLTMQAGTGGTVSPASGYYNSGQAVQISASASGGYSFGSWTGSGSGSYTGTSNPANVTMNGPITETASFTQNPVSVTVQTIPSGRQITVDGTTSTAPQVFGWTPGSQHTIGTTSPQAGGTGIRYVFSNWSDAGAQTHTITTPSSSGTYTVNFTTQYLLTMQAGTGGTVSPAGGYYDSGQGVQIGASATGGYSFDSWTGGGSGSYTGTNNPAQVTMNGPIDETASFTQTGQTVNVSVSLDASWNLISNPVFAPNDSVQALYPNSSNSYAFAYSSGYVQRYTLAVGVGYWEKFPSAAAQTVTGVPISRDTVAVAAGWNVIGTISSAVDTGTIVSLSPGLRASDWYGYANGYAAVTQLVPGKGYWVKANSDGQFVLASLPGPGPAKASASGSTRALSEVLNTLTITDSRGGSQTLYFGHDGEGQIPVAMYGMPPLPPAGAFDARFETSGGGSRVQTHAAKVSGCAEFPVTIQSDAYPVTVTWIVSKGTGSYELTDGVGGRAFRPKEMSGEGAMKIASNALNKFTVKLIGDGELPTEFGLSQNFPNPFNPTTVVSYQLPAASRVRLVVYDLLGREVSTLVNEEQKAGYKSVEWNASNCASGVYFYRLTAGNFVQAKKLLLLR